MQQPHPCSLCRAEDEMVPDSGAGQQIYFYMFHHFLPWARDGCLDGSELGVPVPKSHFKLVFIGSQMPSPEYIVDVESMDIFPVGWCEANAYNLTPPHKAVCKYMETWAVQMLHQGFSLRSVIPFLTLSAHPADQ